MEDEISSDIIPERKQSEKEDLLLLPTSHSQNFLAPSQTASAPAPTSASPPPTATTSPRTSITSPRTSPRTATTSPRTTSPRTSPLTTSLRTSSPLTTETPPLTTETPPLTTETPPRTTDTPPRTSSPLTTETPPPTTFSPRTGAPSSPKPPRSPKPRKNEATRPTASRPISPFLGKKSGSAICLTNVPKATTTSHSARGASPLKSQSITGGLSAASPRDRDEKEGWVSPRDVQSKLKSRNSAGGETKRQLGSGRAQPTAISLKSSSTSEMNEGSPAITSGTISPSEGGGESTTATSPPPTMIKSPKTSPRSGGLKKRFSAFVRAKSPSGTDVRRSVGPMGYDPRNVSPRISSSSSSLVSLANSSPNSVGAGEKEKEREEKERGGEGKGEREEKVVSPTKSASFNIGERSSNKDGSNKEGSSSKEGNGSSKDGSSKEKDGVNKEKDGNKDGREGNKVVLVGAPDDEIALLIDPAASPSSASQKKRGRRASAKFLSIRKKENVNRAKSPETVIEISDPSSFRKEEGPEKEKGERGEKREGGERGERGEKKQMLEVEALLVGGKKDDYRQRGASFVGGDALDVSAAKNVLAEMIDTEKSYVLDLVLLVTHYKRPSNKFISKQEEGIIFANIETLMEIHTNIVKQFGDQPSLESVVCSFEEAIPSLTKEYGVFAEGYVKSIEVLKHTEFLGKEFVTFLHRSRKNPANKGLSLEDFLIKPIQRICKYPLLFRELNKQIPFGHPLFAICRKVETLLQEVALAVNEHEKRRKERMLYGALSQEPPPPQEEQQQEQSQQTQPP